MSVFEKPIELYIGTPVHSDVSIYYVVTCLDLQKECIKNGIPINFQFCKSSLVTQGRQLIVCGFLESTASHLLFVDSDISFKSETIKKMLSKDKDIILCPYPIKDLSFDKIKTKIKEGSEIEPNLLGCQYTLSFIDQNRIEIDDGVAELERGPAGCMLIKREVIETLIKKYPYRKIKQDTLIHGKPVSKENMYNFFDTFWNKEEGTYLGEDFYFCKLCKDAGFKIYGLLDAYITHHGDFGFKGRMVDDLRQISPYLSTENKN